MTNDERCKNAIPAKAGIQTSLGLLDSRLRGNDGKKMPQYFSN